MKSFTPTGLILALALSITPVRADDSAAAFLKQTMQRYSTLHTYQAQCRWSSAHSDQVENKTRTVMFAAPNRFRIVSKSDGMTLTSISDGKRLIEYTVFTARSVRKEVAPKSLADANTMQLHDPVFCGSLLYQFFGGPGNLAHRVNAHKSPIQFGLDQTVDGVPCRTVKFYAGTGLYGNTEVAIGVGDQLVHSLTYDSSPLMAMKAANEKQPLTYSRTTELYTKILTDKPIARDVFAAPLPKGYPARTASYVFNDRPPVPLGHAAPEFSAVPLGQTAPLALSSLRGKVVLVDFWATWCGPCRHGLPETQALAQKFGDKGLTVLAISEEEQKTITDFLSKSHYTFPAYWDADHSANKAYGITGIPTTVIIDKEGHLTAFYVGLQTPEVIRAALKRAGLVMP